MTVPANKELNPAELWHVALRDLELQMTKATFDKWLRGAHAKSLQDDVLTIGVSTTYAVDWLSARLSTTVDRTVTGIRGRSTKVVYIKNGNDGAPITATEPPPCDAPVKAQGKQSLDGAHEFQVEGEYGDLRDSIVKPDQVAVTTQYFRKRWVPVLGPVLAWVIFDLRQRAYWNRFTGERRDEFICTLDDIAHTVGVTTDTILNAFKRECPFCTPAHPVSEHFILRRKPVYRDSASSGKRVCIGTAFKVRLDEPMLPSDAEKIATPDPKVSG